MHRGAHAPCHIIGATPVSAYQTPVPAGLECVKTGNATKQVAFCSTHLSDVLLGSEGMLRDGYTTTRAILTSGRTTPGLLPKTQTGWLPLLMISPEVFTAG